MSACSGTQDLKRAIGVTLESPDAFNVYPRRPLEMPADLSALPPPRPGAPSRLDPQPEAEAQAALSNAGTPVAARTAPSTGELALIEGAGAADPDIRAALASEPETTESPYGLSSFFGIAVPDYKVSDGRSSPVLDPRDEAERIQQTGAATPNPPPPAPETPSNEFILGNPL